MTLPEWTAIASRELRAAGFEVSEYLGFPMVKTPATFADKKKLLDLRLSWSHEKRVYSDGVLVVPVLPPGVPR